jgi:glyoxylase-like metal-dependent hydrolase (beta-lactamase superfamily II)
VNKLETKTENVYGLKSIVPGVYVYQQPDGWCRSNGGVIVGESFAVVVDTQFTHDQNVAYHASVCSLTRKPVRYIINTHHHGDHCYGNHFFPEALTVCHEDAYTQQRKLGQPNPAALKKLFPRFDFTNVRWTPADVTFDQNMFLWQDRREIRLLHFGHTHSLSDIAVYLPEEKVVYCGDFLFYHNTPLGLETSFVNWLKVLDALLNLDANYYVPGHGPVCGKEGLEDLQGYIRLIRKDAKRSFTKGLSSYEAALDINLGKYKSWAAWERVVANVERLYHEFRGEAPDSPIDVNGLMGKMAAIAERS